MVDLYVGQKVVCIDAKPRRPKDDLSGLKEGVVYTVRGITGSVMVPGETSLYLFEIVRPKNNPETPFLSTRFRPYDDRATDISEFHEILHKFREGALL